MLNNGWNVNCCGPACAVCVISVMKSSWESEAADLYSLFNDDESWWAQEGYMFIWMHKQSARVNLSAKQICCGPAVGGKYAICIETLGLLFGGFGQSCDYRWKILLPKIASIL